MYWKGERKIVKRNLIFVINSLECGGAEKSLISLLSTIDYEKYAVDLLMFKPGGMFIDLLPIEVNVLPEIEFMKFNRCSLKEQIKNPEFLYRRIRASVGLRMNRRKKVLHDAQCYWKYTHQVFSNQEKEYDVAIAWGQGNPTHYVAEKVRSKKKIAFINVNYELAGHNKKFDYKFYEKYKYIVAVSDKLSDLIKRVFNDMQSKIKTVYDINNADLIMRMAEKESPYKKLTNEIVIVTVGRLAKEKGYDLATNACSQLIKSGLCFKWYIVGDGPERKIIEQEIKEYGLEKHMILVGAKDNPYVYMKNADVYVQTSKFEGYCLTLKEARILNIPVVSTNFDVVHNQIKNEYNGLIVEMDGKAISNGIIRMIEDIELRENIIENIRKEQKGNTEEIMKFYEIIE